MSEFTDLATADLLNSGEYSGTKIADLVASISCGKAVVPRRRAGLHPFTLMAFDPAIFTDPANPPIEACEGKFWISEDGGGNTCTTCYAHTTPCPLGSDTVMYDGGRMVSTWSCPSV